MKRRGKGNSFGVNIPMEPLARAGFRLGDRLSVKAIQRQDCVVSAITMDMKHLWQEHWENCM